MLRTMRGVPPGDSVLDLYSAVHSSDLNSRIKTVPKDLTTVWPQWPPSLYTLSIHGVPFYPFGVVFDLIKRLSIHVKNFENLKPEVHSVAEMDPPFILVVGL